VGIGTFLCGQPSSCRPTVSSKATASEITKSTNTDVEKAAGRSTSGSSRTPFRNPEKRAVAGAGDIRLHAWSPEIWGGKCADLNALYVGPGGAAARALAPREDVYGIFASPSPEMGLTRGLGASSEKVTKAQQLPGRGLPW